MRILLIANPTIQSDAVKQVLLSEDGWEVHQLTHDQVENNLVEDSVPQCDLAIVDLMSYRNKSEDYIKKMAKKESARLVALHNYDSKILINSLNDAGATQCLSIGSETQQFLKDIKELGSKSS